MTQKKHKPHTKHMKFPFATRNPTPSETQQLALVLSTYCDGSGMVSNGCLPGWRDVERSIAAVFAGVASENKDVFDVVFSPPNADKDIGFSIKCKKLSGQCAMAALDATGSVYMELANSPAKFWKALEAEGFSEADFRAMKHPDRIGEIVLDTVQSWHKEAAENHHRATGRMVDLSKSVYLTLSYGHTKAKGPLFFQWHSFPLTFSDSIQWQFRSQKLLKGVDSARPNKTLFDWYGLSGGQLKYYPLAASALYKSDQFTLEQPPAVSLIAKASAYWPEKWSAATGEKAGAP